MAPALCLLLSASTVAQADVSGKSSELVNVDPAPTATSSEAPDKQAVVTQLDAGTNVDTWGSEMAMTRANRQRLIGDGLAMGDVDQAVVDKLNDNPFGDYSFTIGNGCHLGFEGTEQPECRYGTPSAERSIFVFGDSHVGHWFPAYDEFGKSNGWGVHNWTKAGCPAADVTINSQYIDDQPYTACTAWRDQRIADLIEMNPEVVVVGQDDTIPGTQVTNEEWAEKTYTTVKKLTDEGIHVIFVLDNFTKHPYMWRCLKDNLSNPGACVHTPSSSEVHPGRRDTMRSYLNSRHDDHLYVYDSHEVLCKDDHCPPVVDGFLTLRDQGHISESYAKTLAPEVGALVRLTQERASFKRAAVVSMGE